MDCLSENVDDLSEECQKVVREYVEEVDEDPEIDEIFARSCAPFWEKHCKVCGHYVVAWKTLLDTAVCIVICNVIAVVVDSVHYYAPAPDTWGIKHDAV